MAASNTTDPDVDARHGIPTIVVGFDGSRASRGALVFAARQAGRSGRVVIVNAFDDPSDRAGEPAYHRAFYRRRRAGRELLAALPLDGDELAGPEYDRQVLAGPAASAIDGVARAECADEIIVGSRGRGRVRTLLGSVSAELLRIADRPVVVIPDLAVEPPPQPADAELSAEP